MLTALEPLPSVLQVPAAMDTFRGLQPLPLPDKQRTLLQEYVGATWDFDTFSTHWCPAAEDPLPTTPPWLDLFHDAANSLSSFLPWPHAQLYLPPPAHTADVWTKMLLFDLRHAALHSCLHECRPKTCHKGKLGRHGRLGFWHWRDVSAWVEADTWQRCHGKELRARCSIGHSPNNVGELLSVRHHPFHTRFNWCHLHAMRQTFNLLAPDNLLVLVLFKQLCCSICVCALYINSLSVHVL